MKAVFDPFVYIVSFRVYRKIRVEALFTEPFVDLCVRELGERKSVHIRHSFCAEKRVFAEAKVVL